MSNPQHQNNNQTHYKETNNFQQTNKQNRSIQKLPASNSITKTVNLQNLVQHPSSLKLLILHTPYKLQISTLWKCTNLIKLDLSKNNLDRFPFIGNLCNLKFMFLHQNKLDYTVLKGIFYSQDQPQYSPLSKSIIWVTFYGNKNVFQARHFLVNQTSVIAVDHNMVVPEQKKQAISLPNNYFPFNAFDQITDIRSIINNSNNKINKNTTQEEYMQQFWKQMKLLRKKTQQIFPIIKIQKVFKSWILRKKIQNSKQELAYSIQLKKDIIKNWAKETKRNKLLEKNLKLKNKQHLLLPLKQMKIQNIRRKLIQWVERAKKKVLLRKVSLVSEVRFFSILKTNVLMFKSIYDCLLIQKSNFIMIDRQSYNNYQKILKKFIFDFHGDQKFEIEQNIKYIVRLPNQGKIKKQFPRIISLNQRSYVIKLYNKTNLKENQNISQLSKFTNKCIIYHQRICTLPSHLTKIKPLYSNHNKVHFNKKQIQQYNQLQNKIHRNQKMMLNQYILLKSNNKRLLKDIVRCIFYINTKIFYNIDGYQKYLKQTKTQKKVQLFSEGSINKLAAVTYLQKFWRGFTWKKINKQQIFKKLKERRAAVKIQRWIRNLPSRKRYLFRKQITFLIKSIKDRCFYIQINDYLKCIEMNQKSKSLFQYRLKFIEQNIIPYVDFNNKKILLYWNQNSQIDNLSPELRQTIQICYNLKKKPFDTNFLNSLFKQPNNLPIMEYPYKDQQNQHIQKGQLSHLFHFNTWVSLINKDKKKYLKVTCISVQQTKLRVLGILIKSYTFSRKFMFNIYNEDTFKLINKENIKIIINKQSIFVTKGDMQLKQNNQNIKKFLFKAKMYLNQDTNIKPTKIEQNLLIFVPSPVLSQGIFKEEKIENKQRNSISEGERKKTRLVVDSISLSDIQDNKKVGTKSFSAKRRNYSTVKQSDRKQINTIQKSDLLPHALKRIIPLKKQIRSYKVQKRIIPKERQPSFILDNVSKNQRFVTQTDESQQNQNSFHLQKPDPSTINYSSVRQKIKLQYQTKKNLMKSAKEQSSFYQNFMNINNFIQEQQLYERIRRVKTQTQIQAIQSASLIRLSNGKANQIKSKKNQIKFVKVQRQSKEHKQMLQYHKKLKQKQKQELQKIKSIQREKKALSKHQVKRLKVTFAQQCFPIINRSYNNLEKKDKMSSQKWNNQTSNH